MVPPIPGYKYRSKNPGNTKAREPSKKQSSPAEAAAEEKKPKKNRGKRLPNTIEEDEELRTAKEAGEEIVGAQIPIEKQKTKKDIERRKMPMEN